MRTLSTVAALREAVAGPRRTGRRIGLVPTMGAFHRGHLSLMDRARADCDLLVVSLFVNPTQFDDPSDLDAYPRDRSGDEALASQAGVDLLFAPPAAEVYPPGFATRVQARGLTDRLEGASRGPGHFSGVATVVSKLFNMVGPDVAYFGQKDAQQVAVIRQLVRDLNLPVRIEVCPTVRDPDGLALSSRNAQLSAQERERARSLPRALATVTAAIAAGARDPEAATAQARRDLEAAGVELDYLELVTPDTLAPLTRLERPLLAVIAGRVGSTRLIDNVAVAPPVERLAPPPTLTATRRY